MLTYLLVVNAFGFLLMYIDKKRAQEKRRRIPEKVLLFFSFIGGCFGALLGMYLFRHKTKHLLFVILLPTLSALQILFFILSKR